MPRTSEDQRASTLQRLLAIDSARRGQLSKQYFTRTHADGRTVRQGPYYVWQRSVNGRKRSVRIPSSQIQRVQAELDRGREVQALLDEWWGILEQNASATDSHSKKKSRQSSRPATRKRSAHSA